MIDEHKTDFVFVTDVDGCLTDGGFYYTANEGKLLKKFGSDDWDALKELQEHMRVCIVTGDKKGFPITSKRIKEEMGFDLNLVSHKPKERWDWISSRFPNQKVVYVGDGIYDYYCLEQSYYGIAPCDALYHVLGAADHVSNRRGGQRFVAEACLHVMEKFLNIYVARIGQ
jgi:3-deoxy-D-manno-octulosonate 8-phosphate phosphatase (KDO 8-P phosphatase)